MSDFGIGNSVTIWVLSLLGRQGRLQERGQRGMGRRPWGRDRGSEQLARRSWELEGSCPPFVRRLQNDNPQVQSSHRNVLFRFNNIFSGLDPSIQKAYVT